MPEMTIEKIEKLRLRSTGFALKALVLFAISMWVLYHAYQSWETGRLLMSIGRSLGGLFLIIISCGYAEWWWINFTGAWAAFYHRRCYHATKSLREDGYGFERFSGKAKNIYSKWGFWRADNLKEFERSLLERLHSYRRAEDMLKQEQRWEKAGIRIAEQLVDVLLEFHVPTDEQGKILEKFYVYANPKRRREFLNNLCFHLTYKQWRESNPLPVGNDGLKPITLGPDNEDVRTKSLEIQASKVVGKNARHYYEEGLKASLRRDRIRHFGRALNEDVREAEVEMLPKNGSIRSTPAENPVAEVRHISLQSFVRERLAIMESLICEVDWRMCREIVLVLAEPGRSGGRFNKHYYAEDTVKRMVRRQCNMYADIPFDPPVFEKAISLLLELKIVVTKAKTDERTLSLSSHVNNATTREAGEIIAAVLRIKREVSGLSV
ncbi:MAG: hypothetical protein WAX80_03480 [Minisyncoccia bacterium]